MWLISSLPSPFNKIAVALLAIALYFLIIFLLQFCWNKGVVAAMSGAREVRYFQMMFLFLFVIVLLCGLNLVFGLLRF